MKIDWNTVLKSPKNEPLKDADADLTIGALAYQLLLVSDPQANLSGATKLAQAKLAKKVAEESEITLDDAKMIKDLVGKYASPAAVLAVEEVFDPKE